MNTSGQGGEALLLAPAGRDGELLRALLAEAGLEGRSFPTLEALTQALGEDARLVVLIEEAVRGADLSALGAWIEAQPPWSDLPFLVLTRRGGGVERNPAAARLQSVLGNVSFIERPFHPMTLVSAARSAACGRGRQYEARASLERLRAGEERLRRLAETLEERVAARTAERDRVWRASRDLYLTIGEDGTFRDVNPAWETELGHVPADLIGVRFDQLVHPEDRALAEQRWLDVLGGEIVTDFEVRVLGADGGHRWYAWSVFADDDLVVAVGRDVEERRAREEELRAAEEALRQSQKLEMIGQLTGGVAHDFNNLLMAIQSSVELAARRLEDDPGRARHLLDNALQGVARGATLTQRMLAFARKQTLAAGPVDIALLMEGMRDLLARSLGPGIEIEIAAAPGLPPALVDANQLEMAVLNLAVNARDAMDGAGRLRIELDDVDGTGALGLKPGRYVRLGVQDDGAGMDAETLARAREPFFTTKGVGKGTGLGLSMVHGLAEQSGGVFVLESALGSGTAARIILPVAEGTPHAPASHEAGLEAAGNATSRTLRILAVDDDALVLMGTEAMIEDLGHEVLIAASGAEALDVLSRHEVDVVLTDQAMPKMTGLQLARRIREEHPCLPVILATGYSEEPEGAAGLFVARIGKPFDTGNLENALQAFRQQG